MKNEFSHGYALLIGVGESAYPKWSLPVTVKDMQALRAILTDPALWGYPDDDAHFRLLHDVEPFDLTGSALPAEAFTVALREVKAKRLLAFVESCHAAGMATAKDQPAMKQLVELQGRYETSSNRIAALDKDLGRTLDSGTEIRYGRHAFRAARPGGVAAKLNPPGWGSHY